MVVVGIPPDLGHRDQEGAQERDVGDVVHGAAFQSREGSVYVGYAGLVGRW